MKFKSDIEVQAGLKDSAGNAGASGQVLSTSGTSVSWIDPALLPADSAENLITEVYNETGATLTKGTVVYINGGHGNLPTITKALATSDATSAQTYGVVRADITNNNNGWVVVTGRLEDLDTQAYSPGTVLYLSSTTAGQWTSTKQYAPAHLVYVGIVVRSHPTQGIVEVKIQNGYELDELHNVAAQTPSNNDGIFYNTSSSLWEAKSISAAGGQAQLSGTGFVKASGTTISYDNTTYYPYPTGTTSQYVRGDGSLATFPTIPATPTLDQVLTAGNTSTQDANIGVLGLWDNSNAGYATIKADDNNFTFKDYNNNYVLVAEQGNLALSKTNTIAAGLYTTSLTASRNYNFPDASGTIALTSDIPVPTLDYVLAEGNTSLSDAYILALGLWDSINSNYITLGTTDQGVTFNVPSVGEIFVAQNDGISFGDGALASIKNDLLTAPRVFQLPNASGTLALTSDISGFISGSGTTNYIPKFTSSSTIGNSLIYDNGTNVGIGTTSPGVKLVTVTETNSSGPTLGSGTVGSQALLARNGLYGMYSGVSNSGDVWHQVQRNDTNTSVYNLLLQPAGGYVGIGTSNPTQKLQIGDGTGTNAQYVRVFSAQSDIYIGQSNATILGLPANSGQLIVADGVSFPLGIGTVSAQPLVLGTQNTEKMRITSSGYVGIGTTNPTALLTVAGDALINSVTVGRGGGNISSNTVVGRNSFTYNSLGIENTVIGANAGNSISSGNSNVIIGKVAGAHIDGGSGNTIIGTNNSFPPTGIPTDYSDTLSISKRDSSLNSYLPHIWAPEKVSTSATVDVITVDYSIYRAMFVEYVIEDESGNIRGGYIKGIWNSDATIIKMTEETTSSIGLTEEYVFNIIQSTTDTAILQLTSYSGNPVYCSVTSRLLTRPY